MNDSTFDPNLIYAIFKSVWSERALEREKAEFNDVLDSEDPGIVFAGFSNCCGPFSVTIEDQDLNVAFIPQGPAGAGSSRKNRPTSANANALKLSCELLRVFVTEAIQRAAAIAESEGSSQIEATHLAGGGSSRKNRPTFATMNALKLSSKLLWVFITEAIQRAAAIAESEGSSKIEASHLESILPQLLLDFKGI